MRRLIIVLGVFIALASGRYIKNANSVKCPAQGNFPHPTSTNPRRYIECRQTESGTYVAKVKSCTETEVFDPSSQKCEPRANFGRILLAESAEDDSFTCEATGLYEDDDSPNCEGYYQCVEQDGVLKAVSRTCPNGEIFMPELSTCVTPQFYNCPRGGLDPDPVITTTTTEKPTTTTKKLTTTESTVHTPPHTDDSQVTGRW